MMLPIIQFVSLIAGIVFIVMGMHYRAHDEKTAASQAYTNPDDSISHKTLTPTGIKAVWYIRGFRYNLIGAIFFCIAAIPAIWRLF